AVFPNQRQPLGGADPKVHAVEYEPCGTRIVERHFSELEPVPNRPGDRYSDLGRTGFRADCEEIPKIVQEKRLIGDAREGGESALNLRAGAVESPRQKREAPERQPAHQRLPDDERVGTVIAEDADQPKDGTRPQPAPLEHPVATDQRLADAREAILQISAQRKQ